MAFAAHGGYAGRVTAASTGSGLVYHHYAVANDEMETRMNGICSWRKLADGTETVDEV